MRHLDAQVVVGLVLLSVIVPGMLSQSAHSIHTWDNFVALVEKIERDNSTVNKPLKVIANYIRRLAYDDDKWRTLLGGNYDPLPDSNLTSAEKTTLTNMINHRFIGHQEQGVVHTPFGDVAMGRVITGICAGISRNKYLRLPWIQPIDNLHFATLAGDLALTSLVHKTTPSLPLLGPGGTWSPNLQCPTTFYASLSTHSKATDAQIRGGIDGFLLGYKLPEWTNRGVRLGQLLRMYYQGGVVYDKEFAACRRMSTFRKIVDDSDLAEQINLGAQAVKRVWNNSLDFSSVQNSEIPQLANTTTRQLYNRISNFNSGHICPADGQDEGCSLSANIVFVLDESGSIGYRNYEVSKDFVQKIIDEFDISSYQTRVGVVEYANYAKESIKLGGYSSKSTLSCAVEKLTFAGGGTSTSQALQTAHRILRNAQSQAGSGHINDPQIVILLTDGQSNGGVSALRPVVEDMKKDITGLTMIAVGIGSYNRAELELIATDPTKHVFDTTDFSKLISLAKQLQNQTCETATVLLPDSQSINSPSYSQTALETKVTGYVRSGQSRYFKLESDTLSKMENVTVQVKPFYGSVNVYGSRSDATPDEDSHDFKHQVDEVQNKSSNTEDGKVLQFSNICRGYNASACPSLYMSIVGQNSSMACLDRDCSVPDEIKFELIAGMHGYCPCANGGKCKTTPTGYNCSCPPKYTGQHCESLDVCYNYKVLNSSDRSRHYPTITYRCDRNDLSKGWYRFTGAAGSQIATSCVPRIHCDTYYSGWMSGSHPAVAEGIVSRRVCYSYNYYNYDTCCRYSNYIRVRNCGSFFVYELDQPPTCNLRYCGNGTDVCQNYTELSSADRSRYHPTRTQRCDQYDLTKGWYRFTGAAGSQIATSCVPRQHCNTYYTGWMSGSHPTSAEGIVTRQVCYTYSSSCCYYYNRIRVKNCGSFYIYELDRTPRCNMRYCGNGTVDSNCTNGRPCYNGGTCLNNYYNYYCTCPNGYTGTNCETNVCREYTELNSTDRSRYSPTTTQKCDRNDLARGWYRFTGAAGSHIASTCVPWHHCNTYYSGWMSGAHPTVAEGIVSRSVCYSYSYTCCYYSNTIHVRNCGSFFVYELDRPRYCNMRYCGNGTENTICVNGRPCYNGGMCRGTYSRYYCTCSRGYAGSNCETNLMVKVTCDTRYIEVELTRAYFPNIDWRNLHLNDPACRATTVTSTAIRIRTPLSGCGTNHTEHSDWLEFRNQVKMDNRFVNPNQTVITRESNTLQPFHCKYTRRQLVSTSFNPATETVRASEGNFGNFTFTMNLCKSGECNNMYLPYEYPVEVTLNQLLWIQFKVTNTNGDLVVFADSCRATTSTDPNSSPQYEFMRNGCAIDTTMDYKYDKTSSVQNFSIKSFRFINTAKKLVYLHCELMVCHRNSANSRCSRGCVSSRRRRRSAEGNGENTNNEDTSETYDLSTGPIDGQSSESSNTNENTGSQAAATGMVIGMSVMGVLLAVVCVAVIVKFISAKILKPRKIEPASINAVNANDGQAALQLDEINRPRELEL